MQGVTQASFLDPVPGDDLPQILAVDPGNKRSAWVLLHDRTVLAFGLEPNVDVMVRLAAYGEHCVIEYSKAYTVPILTGKKQGLTFFPQQVLDTAMQVGRMAERWEANHQGSPAVCLLSRREIKMYLCGASQARDAQVREAMIDRWGGDKASAIGLKNSPGPLYGFKKDLWAALAVAVTYRDTLPGAFS